MVVVIEMGASEVVGMEGEGVVGGTGGSVEGDDVVTGVSVEGSLVVGTAVVVVVEVVVG